MANNNQTDYLESLFKGIDIILEKRLDGVLFDKTIICTITDASNKKNGEYRVTDGSVTYLAYADVDSYVAGEQVRVSVPMGDFSQKKFITGKYAVDNESAPITYVSPLSSIVNMSGNLVPLGKTASITANGTDRKIIIWNQTMDSGSYADLQANGIYNTIILKADFKTLLSNYDLTAGTYGLRLDLLVRPSVESTGRIRTYIELSSKEMFGNPYSFSIFSTQAKTFDITSIGIIEGIELSLYQNGNFKDRTKGPIIPNALTDDIIVSNIELGFGSDITEVDDNVVRIYSQDSLNYRYQNPSNDTNLKTIGLLWYNKDEDNQYVGFSDGVYAPTYDELDYLKDARMDTRLVAQKGREGIPTDQASLNLAANLEEAVPLIEKAIDVANKDLYQVLSDLYTQVKDIDELATPLQALLLSTKSEYIGTFTKTIQDYLDNNDENSCDLKRQYAGVLDYARDTQLGKAFEDPRHSAWDPKWKENYGYKIKEQFIAIYTNTKNALTAIYNKVKSPTSTYAAYKGIYDSYKIRIDRVLETMYEYLKMSKDETGELTEYNKNFPASLMYSSTNEKSDYKALQACKNKTTFKTYQEKDLSAYANKYCIYWYKYEKDYVDTNPEALMPAGWRRLTAEELNPSEDKNSPHSVIGDSDGINVGLPTMYYYDDDTIVHKYDYRTTNIYNKKRTYYTRTKVTNDNGKTKYVYTAIPDVTKALVENKNQNRNYDIYVRVCVNEDGKFVHAPKPNTGSSMIKRYMQKDVSQEKYVAVVFYNHNMYKSNELIFTNSDVIPDKTTLDKGDILIFEHLENSSDKHQLYTELGYLQDVSQEQAARQLRCHYDGLLAKDEALVSAGIYWYIPNYEEVIDSKTKATMSTMLRFDAELLKDRGFSTDIGLSKKPSYSKPGYACFYKKIKARKMCGDCDKLLSECNCEEVKEEPYWDFTNGEDFDYRDIWYKVAPYYDESCVANSILCEVHIEDDQDPVKGEQLFTFSTFGTNGTKYTLDVVNKSTMHGTMAKDDNDASVGRVELEMILTDATGVTIPLNTTGSAANLKAGDAYGCSVAWKFRNGNNDGLRLLPAGAAQATGVQVDADHYGIFEVKTSFALPSETDAKDGDAEPVEDTNGQPTKYRVVDLDCLQAVPWGANYYYLSGPKQIVYNMSGTLDNNSMYDAPYSLRWCRDIFNEKGKVVTKAHTVVKNVKWAIKYYVYDSSTKKFVELKPISNPTTEAQKEKQKLYQFYKDYMPVINANGGLTPSSLYLDGLDCYAVVEASIGNAVQWKQPIIIVQNRYGSTLLNSWDGSLTIDKKNGTILATMIGAGRKSSNNTFEGVLMGDVATNAGLGSGFDESGGASIGTSNHRGLGIYGFNDGAQSFGFNIDGTAFLGKAGKGRIIFDGNYGIIASMNWFSGTNNSSHPDYHVKNNPHPRGGKIGTDGAIYQTSNDGMCIDLESGHIDAYNFKLTSQNIYFNSVPGTWNKDNQSYMPYEEGYYNYFFKIGDAKKTGYIGLTSDGRLEIRVNSFQMTGKVGNDNLFKQTSPRETKLVPHYIKISKVKTATQDTKEDENGKIVKTIVQKVEEYDAKYSKKNHNGQGKPVYTYDVSVWSKRTLTGGKLTALTETAWEYSTDYDKDVLVKHLGNVWKAGSDISAPDEPPKEDSPAIIYPPGNNSEWVSQISVKNDVADKPYYLYVNGDNIALTQALPLIPYQEYTVSGHVKSDTKDKTFKVFLENDCKVIYSNLDNIEQYNVSDSFELKDTEWHYFQCTFRYEPKCSSCEKLKYECECSNPSYSKDDQTIGFVHEVPYSLWHAKLEEGSVATSWVFNSNDIEANSKSDKNQLDNKLYQNTMFDKLFKDPVTGELIDGYELVSSDKTLSGRPELYICATYIATGILRSKNWDGTFGIKWENGKYVYSLTGNPTQGTYFDLDTGKMWAAQFELNAHWGGQGLYLNSHPKLSTNTDLQYYLKLGDMSQSYITFDALGNLKMKVNSFELTSAFGGGNLLNDTEPKGSIGKAIRNVEVDTDTKTDGIQPVAGAHWGYSANDIKAQIGEEGDKSHTVRLYNKVEKTAGSYRSLYQDIATLDRTESDKYVLSGWVWIPGPKERLEFRIRPVAGSTTQTVSDVFTYQPTKTGWQRIFYIFTLDSSYTYEKPRLAIRDYNLSVFKDDEKDKTKRVIDKYYFTHFYHLKLEAGTVATQWCESDIDKQDALNIYDSEELLQEAVFNKLTNNGAAKGIFLSGGELYINATYIATGVLRSENFNGTINSNGTITGGTAGMYINLNDGKVWAKNFTLITGESGKAGYIKITSDASKTGSSYNHKPLTIGQYFSVDWNGSVSASSGYVGNWKITGGNLQSNNGSVTLNGSSGSISGSTLSGATVYASTLKAGKGNGGADGTYILVADSTGVTISGATISGGDAGGGKASYDLSADGKLTANSATLSNLTVTSSLTVNASSSKARAAVAVPDAGGGGGGGSTALATINGNTSITGNTTIGGTLTIGTASNEASTTVNGTTSITGNTTIGGDLTFDGQLTVGEKPAYAYGTEHNIVIDVPWTEGTSGTATFSNGILTGWTQASTSGFVGWLLEQFPIFKALVPKGEEDPESTTTPTAFGKLAFVDDIKKKFKVTMSSSSNLYTCGDSEYCCTSTGTYTVYAHIKGTDVVLSTSDSPPDGYTYTGKSLYPGSYGKNWAYRRSATAVSSITGTSDEITFGPNDGDVVDTITLSISEATVNRPE